MGLASLLAAVALLVDVVWLHWYTGTPATEGIVDELRSDENTTRLQVLADTRAAAVKNEGVLRKVEWRYRVGAGLAAMGTLALGVGVIVMTLQR